MPAKTEKQRKAMYAAAEGKSKLGIPQSVGKEFIASDDDEIKGAGILHMTPNDEVLFLLRSSSSDEPHTWGLPFGKSEPNETAEQTAERESFEEIGASPYGELSLLCAKDGFTTFLKHILHKFTPKLNDEHVDWRWAKLEDAPEPLHPGVRAVIDTVLNGSGVAQDAEFEESKHPRAANGQFGSGGGGGTKKESAATAKNEKENVEHKEELIELFHGGYQVVEEITDSGVFGGLFASESEGIAASHGENVHKFLLKQNEILTYYDIDHILEPEVVNKAISKAIGSTNKKDIALIRGVVNEKEDIISSPELEKIMKILGEDDAGEASWKIQKIRGIIAKEAGYKAVEQYDEHNMSYLILPGNEITEVILPENWGVIEEPSKEDEEKRLEELRTFENEQKESEERRQAAKKQEEEDAKKSEIAGKKKMSDLESEHGKEEVTKALESILRDNAFYLNKILNESKVPTKSTLEDLERYLSLKKNQESESKNKINDFVKNYGASGVKEDLIDVFDGNKAAAEKVLNGEKSLNSEQLKTLTSYMSSRKKANDQMIIAFDRASVRTVDQDGRMRVELSHISKAMVCPYLGEEIPDYESLGLDSKKVYMLLRDADELKKSVSTWNSVPLLNDHIAVSADDHQPQAVVGATGTNASFNHPYLDNSLVIWSQDSIDGINSGRQQEISCAYYYTPDMTPGNYEGIAYDGVMRNIRANHVALVEKGRAGPDVLVSDSAILVWDKSMKTALVAMDAEFEESAHPRASNGQFGSGAGKGKYGSASNDPYKKQNKLDDKSSHEQHVKERDAKKEEHTPHSEYKGRSEWANALSKRANAAHEKAMTSKSRKDIEAAKAEHIKAGAAHELALQHVVGKSHPDEHQKSKSASNEHRKKFSQLSSTRANDSNLNFNNGANNMGKSLSKKAVMAKGALLAVLKPAMLAADSHLDLNKILDEVKSKNWLNKKPGILAAIKPHLAKDADLDQLIDLLDRLDGQGDDDDIGMDDDDEDMVEAMDDGHEAILAKLRGKISDEDLADILEMLKAEKEPVAMDNPPQTANAANANPGDPKDDLQAKDEDEDDKKDKEEKMDKKAMDRAIKLACDAAARDAELKTIARLRGIAEAEELVRPYVGKLTAMDSAEEVLKAALVALNVDVSDLHPSAYRTVLKHIPNPNAASRQVIASDRSLSPTADIYSQFPDLLK